MATAPTATTTSGSESRSLAAAVLAPFHDAWLATRVRFALLAGLGASAAEITVAAYYANVVLEGVVADEATRARAERTASALASVVGVSNRVRVRGALGPRTGMADAEIRAAVAHHLREHRTLRGSTIHVASVYDGVLTLAGTARSQRAHAVAFELAIRTPGVRRVVHDVALHVHADVGRRAAA